MKWIAGINELYPIYANRVRDMFDVIEGRSIIEFELINDEVINDEVTDDELINEEHTYEELTYDGCMFIPEFLCTL